MPKSLDALEARVHEFTHCDNYERIQSKLKGLSPQVYRLRNTDWLTEWQPPNFWRQFKPVGFMPNAKTLFIFDREI